MRQGYIAAVILMTTSAARAGLVDIAPITDAKPAVFTAIAAEPDSYLTQLMFNTDYDITCMQTLLGQYVAGRSINGPVLISNPVEIKLSMECVRVLRQFPFLHVVMENGHLDVLLGGNAPSEYGRIRAEFMASMPRLIKLERMVGAGNELSRGHLLWARNLMIVGQHECVNMVGPNEWRQYCP